MGAFCVFGVSKTLCKEKAGKKTVTSVAVDGSKKRRELTPAEWAEHRDELADHLFATIDKPVKVSPEFDAPQFCRDWLSVCPSEVRMPRIMVRGQKTTDDGTPIARNGKPVMTWLEYRGQP
ncbi:hypothetical protein [Pseudoduganella chitinolytica]|uniref:Uncharacterized protein n=1 Tax=Pseudoduganella chitinolytica TaxID=34070 RepID=A0ABY8BKT5_9BURK|nr:hypothetical protein [Pseudoduganella chitinolytica]WEF34884.1 hypothetical protein PX653_09030 [Pseudoduganella chitinolytica]